MLTFHLLTTNNLTLINARRYIKDKKKKRKAKKDKKKNVFVEMSINDFMGVCL